MKFIFKIVLLTLFVLNLLNCTQTSVPSEPEAKLQTYALASDVLWANPDGHALTMDIYTPETGQINYPVLVIFHGGGWLINDKSPLTAMSEYMAQNAGYVICNVNYRLLIDQGNTITMNQIIEDVMGSVLWIKENISAYKGNPQKIMITGDSAGGHLAAMVLLARDRLETDGFSGVSLGYNPSYLPAGKTPEDLVSEHALDVQGAIFSYAAFDITAACIGGMETAGNIFWSFTGTPPRGIFGDTINVVDNPEYYHAVSPITLVPHVSEKMLPPVLCTAGSADFVVPPASVESFVNLMRDQGQSVEYWVHEGRNHAFLDGGSNPFLGTEFERDGIPAIQKMIAFMDQVFYTE